MVALTPKNLKDVFDCIPDCSGFGQEEAAYEYLIQRTQCTSELTSVVIDTLRKHKAPVK